MTNQMGLMSVLRYEEQYKAENLYDSSQIDPFYLWTKQQKTHQAQYKNLFYILNIFAIFLWFVAARQQTIWQQYVLSLGLFFFGLNLSSYYSLFISSYQKKSYLYSLIFECQYTELCHVKF